jgi:small neutral amino acid transporter SnatA (MarC family)
MATKAAIAAAVFIAAAVTASVYLIADFIFGERTTAIVTAAVGGAFVLFWFAFPLWRRLQDSSTTRSDRRRP